MRKEGKGKEGKGKEGKGRKRKELGAWAALGFRVRGFG
jgi:hypothetical protein